ncbi:MAG: hypothetical protein WEE50_10185 [Chloroflexota bacterium]
MVDRNSVATDLAVARRRAWALMPYSPAWDAAMAMVEDLERLLWQLEHPAPASPPDHRTADSRQSRVLA